MYNNQLYAEGAYSLLLATWNVTLETPLVIRNGRTLSYGEDASTKSRNQHLHLNWLAGANATHEVAALFDGYEVVDGRVVSYHYVPPSSVRGALRSWVIRHMVPSQFFAALVPTSRAKGAGDSETDPPLPDASSDLIPSETQEAAPDLQAAFQTRKNGFHLVASLFGFATDTRDGTNAPANAGRLSIETDKFRGAAMRKIRVAGATMEVEQGPENVARQMTVRNPLDRITHASRDGGLHHFLEFSRGATFSIRLRFLNVQPTDLGLLYLWQREIENGLLRFGALASIGRGRVSVQPQSYTLWRRRNAPVMAGLEQFRQLPAGGDILDCLWEGYEIDHAMLESFVKTLKDDVWEP